jgi:hypothetical protein
MSLPWRACRIFAGWDEPGISRQGKSGKISNCCNACPAILTKERKAWNAGVDEYPAQPFLMKSKQPTVSRCGKKGVQCQLNFNRPY